MECNHRDNPPPLLDGEYPKTTELGARARHSMGGLDDPASWISDGHPTVFILFYWNHMFSSIPLSWLKEDK